MSDLSKSREQRMAEYEAKAAEAEENARVATDLASKVQWQNIAYAWRQLAKHVRNVG